MKIQSLSICVPAGCPNNCKFCVAKMHREDYKNNMSKKIHGIEKELFVRDYKTRMQFARDNGCNTIMFTGNGEPLVNFPFVEDVININNELTSPFKMIELQTAGNFIDEEMAIKLRWLGFTTISLSLSNIFDSNLNAECNGMTEKTKTDIDELCRILKKHSLNLRLSLNMTDFYNNVPLMDIFNRAKDLGADQITFRKLYCSLENSPQKEWVEKHAISEEKLESIKYDISHYGKPLEVLPFGLVKYSLNEISTVIDDDCMSKSVSESIKYLLLRENCKLYTKWDDKGSLLF